MEYSKLCQYADRFAGEYNKDLVHDLYLDFHNKGINLLENDKPKNYIFRALKWRQMNTNDKEYKYRRKEGRVYTIPYDELVSREEEPGSHAPVSALKNYTPSQPFTSDLYDSEDLLGRLKKVIEEKSTYITYNRFMKILDLLLQGYPTKEIASMLGEKASNVYHYRKWLKIWITDLVREN